MTSKPCLVDCLDVLGVCKEQNSVWRSVVTSSSFGWRSVVTSCNFVWRSVMTYA